MSDIPSGWYPDPQGLEDERYHDGTEWTSETRATPSAQDLRPAPGSSASSTPNAVEGLVSTILSAQIATMNYTRVLALVVMLLFVNAFWGAILFIIISLADPYDGPNVGLVAFVGIFWFGSFAFIAYLVGSAMTEARNAREEIGR